MVVQQNAQESHENKLFSLIVDQNNENHWCSLLFNAFHWKTIGFHYFLQRFIEKTVGFHSFLMKINENHWFSLLFIVFHRKTIGCHCFLPEIHEDPKNIEKHMQNKTKV